MAQPRPTRTELIARINANIEGRLEGADPLLRFAALVILGTTLAGAMHEQNGRQAISLDAILPDKADRAGLDRWARMLKVPQVKADFATGTVIASGNNGVTIPAATILQKPDRSAEYFVTTDAVIAGGSASLSIEALKAGEAGNAGTSAELTFLSPIPGVSSSAFAVIPGLVGGVDQEELERYRARVLNRFGTISRGGTPNDFKQWALEAPGVSRVWVMDPVVGSPDFKIYLANDTQSPPTALAGDITAAEAALRTPVTAGPQVQTATFEALDPEITLNPNTPEVQAAVIAELEDLLVREAAPLKTLPLSKITDAISRAEGEDSHILNSPVTDVTPSGENVLWLGTPVWS